MKINLLTGFLGAVLTLTAQQPRVTQPDRNSDGVQQAIAFEHAKDRADAHQARLEQRHPSIDYSNAGRKLDDPTVGRHLSDPGPRADKKR